MKRVLSVAMAIGVLLSAFLSFGGGAVADESGRIYNEHEDLNLQNAIANAQAVPGADVQTVLSGENKPSIAYVRVSELEDVAAFLELCMETEVLPTLYVETAEEANAVIDGVSDTSFRDLTVVSDNVPVLKNIRNKKALIRTGLVVELPAAQLTSKEAQEIRSTVRETPATFCVISGENATRQAVSELQELALAVWVEVSAKADTDEFKVEALKALTSGANGIISADAAGLKALINDTLSPMSMTRTPIMIGHRGNPSQAPENSLSGFITAYENGADVFEVDVEVTKDDEIVIMHDDTINRTTNYDGDLSVNKMTLSQIKEYFLLANDGSVSDEKVPTLREVLEEFQDKDCRIFVEFKGSNVKNVSLTAALLKEYDMEDRVDVISFSASLINETHDNLPGMSTGYLHSPGGSSMSSEDAIDTLIPSLGSAQSLKSSVNPNKSVVTSHYVQAATDRGITVWPWTYNYGTNNNAFQLCPDGITTDDMQWVTDMHKYIEADAVATVSAGNTLDITVEAVTYGDEVTTIAAEELIVEVITGEECISVKDGVITGVQDGTATVIFGYKTQTKDRTPYVLYTQPVTVTVGGTVDVFTVLLIVLGAVIVLGAAAIVTALVVTRKPKTKEEA